MARAEQQNFIHSTEEVLSPQQSNGEYGETWLSHQFSLCLDQHLAKEKTYDIPLEAEQVEFLKRELTGNFIEAAPDLGTFGLAEGHVSRLIDSLLLQGALTDRDFLSAGAHEFYRFSRDVFGPLWASYVHKVLSSGRGGEVYLFAARDATPMYWVAVGLMNGGEQHYNLDGAQFVHTDWNRWFMGQEDELEEGVKPLSFSDPILKDFYRQMGFGSERLIKIVEAGAWGSAAHALKMNMPDQPFELWFMFSHMPERTFGFLNSHAPQADRKHLEMINDTQEAVPKSYVRPTNLIYQNGRVVADLRGKTIDSPYMQVWSWAVKQGAYDAGVLLSQGRSIEVERQVEAVIQMSQSSSRGIWTGVLPRNTLTWTEGENWIAQWPWGKIPPLE